MQFVDFSARLRTHRAPSSFALAIGILLMPACPTEPSQNDGDPPGEGEGEEGEGESGDGEGETAGCDLPPGGVCSGSIVRWCDDDTNTPVEGDCDEYFPGSTCGMKPSGADCVVGPAGRCAYPDTTGADPAGLLFACAAGMECFITSPGVGTCRDDIAEPICRDGQPIGTLDCLSSGERDVAVRCTAADDVFLMLCDEGAMCRTDGNPSYGFDGCALPPGALCSPANWGACIGDGERQGSYALCTDDVICPGCGDGEVAAGEACDDGNAVDDDDCSNACAINDPCGDGQADGERGHCDDGNTTSGDGCSATCTVESGFACPSDGGPCRNLCGDGNRDDGERCDDGNATAGDGCSRTCTVEAGFSCPIGDVCHIIICGDGKVDERCDDGDLSNGDGCSSSCAIEPGYACVGTPSSCYPIVCGDGFVDGAEGCDDGNTVSFDGCTQCRRDVCSPSEVACASDGTTIVECNQTATGFVPRFDCDDIGEVCRNGSCEPFCDAFFETRCSESNPYIIERCSADGTRFEEHVDCFDSSDLMMHCVDEGGEAECQSVL